MYIQITTRCNMTCEHCCYSCSAEGEDMTLETFNNALAWEIDGYPSIGGGEPTVHPEFEKMLLLAIGKAEGVWLATNGKKTEIALILAKLAHRGVISCELSQDQFHEPIESEVIEAFTKPERKGEYISRHDDRDYRGIRNVTISAHGVINAGRCDFGSDEGCVCEDWLVKPNGDVHQCGCQDAPKLGNVNDPDFEFDHEIEPGCYKNEQGEK